MNMVEILIVYVFIALAYILLITIRGVKQEYNTSHDSDYHVLYTTILSRWIKYFNLIYELVFEIHGNEYYRVLTWISLLLMIGFLMVIAY